MKDPRMKEIGRIKHVQVQRFCLKIGQKPHRYYDPGALLIVSSLLLFPRGTIGVSIDGEHIMDVHHADHPTSRNQGLNGISIGFTSHYQAMRARFGQHLVDGVAGENILVETDDAQTLADLEPGVAIQSGATGQMIRLNELLVAAPCIEFSRFAINDGMSPPNERMKETLQFLDNGRRGFYVTLAESQEPVSIQAGDGVFALSETAK
jgi:hypothetical protein